MAAQRLIDLHCDWLLQYAGETTVFEPALYEGCERRVDQSAGYLQGTSAAVFSCYRRAEDWKRQADPWHALGALITRIEAEFPGRLLIGPDDFNRLQAEPDTLCRGILGVEGFDFLIRGSKDLVHLAELFERGVRVFQPVYSTENRLAGSSEAGDDRGLSDLGRLFLHTLADLPGISRPALDLAHLNPVSTSEILDWYEAEPSRLDRVFPIYSHGALFHNGFPTSRAITSDSLTRLRSLGGLMGFSIGPPFYESTDAIKAGIEAAASLPFRGRTGFEGIAIGTDFLGVDATLARLGNVEDVVAWLSATFGSEARDALIQANAMHLVRRVTGASG